MEPVDINASLEARVDELSSSEEFAEPEVSEETPEDYEASDDEQESPLEPSLEDEEAPLEDDEEALADDEGEEDSEPGTAGTKDDPYTLEDLSADVFFKIKVNGEEHVVSEKDLGKGFVFQREGQARIEKANRAIEEAEQVAHQSQETTNKIRQGFFNTLKDPQALLQVLESDFPDTLDAIAVTHYPTLEKAYNEGRLEQFREARNLSREKRLLQAHREKAQRQTESQRLNQLKAQRLATFRPALEAALKETGFNKISPDLAKDIGSAADTFERRNGREPTTEELTQLAVRWLRANGPTPSNGNAKPRKPRHRGRGKAPKPTVGKAKDGRRKDPPKYEEGMLSTDYLLKRAGL